MRTSRPTAMNIVRMELGTLTANQGWYATQLLLPLMQFVNFVCSLS